MSALTEIPHVIDGQERPPADGRTSSDASNRSDTCVRRTSHSTSPRSISGASWLATFRATR